MSDHRYKQVKKPEPKPLPRYSDAVRKWGDAWQLGAPGGSAIHWNNTPDVTDAALMVLMEKGAIGRVS